MTAFEPTSDFLLLRSQLQACHGHIDELEVQLAGEQALNKRLRAALEGLRRAGWGNPAASDNSRVWHQVDTAVSTARLALALTPELALAEEEP